MRPLTLAIAGVITAMGLAATGQARSDREPITDPAVLQSLGYEPGAGNIYRLDNGTSAAAESDRGGDVRPDSRSVNPFPAGVRGWTTATGFSFFPLTHTNEYVKGPSFLVQNGGLVSITVSGFYEAQLDLPNHAMLGWLDIFGFHNDGSRPLTVTMVERCLPYLTPGNPDETVLASATVINEGANFAYARGLAGHVVNARECSYHVRARFSETGAPAPSLNMQLAKARVEWTPDRIFANGFESTSTPLFAGD